MKVRIVSSSGMSLGTKVYAEDGVEIKHVNHLQINFPINGAVTADIGIAAVACDIEAHPLLSLKTVMEAAELYGYKLMRIEWP